jgi:hypothetical protein
MNVYLLGLSLVMRVLLVWHSKLTTLKKKAIHVLIEGAPDILLMVAALWVDRALLRWYTCLALAALVCRCNV